MVGKIQYVHYRPTPYDPPGVNYARKQFQKYFPQYATGNSFAGNGTQTGTGTSAPNRATSITGGGTYKTAGFVSTTLKPRGKKTDKFNVLGTTLVSEIGGVVNGGIATSTSGNVVAIGHASCPSYTAHILCWRAIIKKLLIRIGQVELSDFDQNIVGIGTGDIIRITYQFTADSSIAIQNFTAGVGLLSPNQFAAAIAAYFTANYDANLSFHKIEYFPATGSPSPAVLPLKRCMLVYSCKSTLKIQNTTVEQTGGDEESVNNVPLHGKAYFGNGTGTEAISRDGLSVVAATTFRADNKYGTIAKVPTERWYQEVVPASHFTQVKQFGKVVLEPGDIKTSVLSYYGKISLNAIYRKLFDNDAALAHTKTSVGTYRFMMLEKMIQATTPSDANSIKVAYECNMRMGCYATMKYDTETAQQNDLLNLATVI